MKKKGLIATIAAATIALSCGSFAACGHKHTYSKDWTKDATNHWHVATCTDLKEGDEGYIKDLAAHSYGEDGKCVCGAEQQTPPPAHTHDYSKWTYNDEQHWKICEADNDVDESTRANHDFTNGDCVCGKEKPAEGPGGEETQEYTITLNVGAGTLPTGAKTTYTTKNGKLDLGTDEYLPEPTIATAHWKFDNWYDAEEGGNAIVEDTTVFTEDTTLYARYIRDNGVWTGDTFIYALTKNVGCTDHDQYWTGDTPIVELTEGDEVSVYFQGELMTYTVFQSSNCIEVPESSARVTSVTVTEDATFKIMLNKWGEGNWQVEYTGIPKNVAGADTIPEGCIPITLKFSNGDVTLYIIHADGTSVDAATAATIQIHAWQTGNTNIYGAWGTNPKLDDADALDLSATVELKGDVTFMFHWAGTVGEDNKSQSGNITSIAVGKAFIVDLRDNSTKVYTGTTPDAE